MMALVPKQVTAYNSVNNSTVSRTSASKYGECTPFVSITSSDRHRSVRNIHHAPSLPSGQGGEVAVKQAEIQMLFQSGKLICKTDLRASSRDKLNTECKGTTGRFCTIDRLHLCFVSIESLLSRMFFPWGGLLPECCRHFAGFICSPVSR